MKKIIVFTVLSILNLSVFSQKKDEKIDTTKKYVLLLTENEFQALQDKLSEAAEYEAQLQKQKTLTDFGTFLKVNVKTIPNKEVTKK